MLEEKEGKKTAPFAFSPHRMEILLKNRSSLDNLEMDFKWTGFHFERENKQNVGSSQGALSQWPELARA